MAVAKTEQSPLAPLVWQQLCSVLQRMGQDGCEAEYVTLDSGDLKLFRGSLSITHSPVVISKCLARNETDHDFSKDCDVTVEREEQAGYEADINGDLGASVSFVSAILQPKVSLKNAFNKKLFLKEKTHTRQNDTVGAHTVMESMEQVESKFVDCQLTIASDTRIKVFPGKSKLVRAFDDTLTGMKKGSDSGAGVVEAGAQLGDSIGSGTKLRVGTKIGKGVGTGMGFLFGTVPCAVAGGTSGVIGSLSGHHIWKKVQSEKAFTITAKELFQEFNDFCEDNNFVHCNVRVSVFTKRTETVRKPVAGGELPSLP